MTPPVMTPPVLTPPLLTPPLATVGPTPFGSRPYAPQIAVVVSGWPRISETFACNELAALQRAGMLAAVFATKPGDDSFLQPHNSVLPTVHVLRSSSPMEQGREVAAALAGRNVDGVHGYFAHQPAEVAFTAAGFLGTRFGFSTHALDARKVTPVQLRERSAAAVCVIACNPDVAATLQRAGVEPTLCPHGVDLERFRPAPRRRWDQGERFSVVAVGRLVEKKGFAHLLDAVARCAPHTHLTIVGDGPLRSELVERCHALGLRQRVRLVGRVTHDDLPAILADADCVVVPSVIDSTGDRDGLPNVVLEAMASQRPVIASRVAAIESAVIDDLTGLLVEPGNAAEIAAAIDQLQNSPATAARIASGARRLAVDKFSLDGCTDYFCEKIADAYAPSPRTDRFSPEACR